MKELQRRLPAMTMTFTPPSVAKVVTPVKVRL
jgi:hypothetical protein